MARYVLDSTAVFSVLFGEAGGDVVTALLDDARPLPRSDVLLPFMTLMEVEYKLLRSLSAEDVEDWINTIGAWPVRVVESSESWRRVAAAVKARARLSLADAWIAALALLEDAELVHKDPEFDSVPSLKSMHLPYKTADA